MPIMQNLTFYTSFNQLESFNKVGKYVLGTVSLRSCEYSKNNKSFYDKIHYITIILYLNYKKNEKTVLSIKKYFQMYANTI